MVTENMKYIKKIEGVKCYLAPLNIDDAGKVAIWSNDLELSLNTGDICDSISVTKQREYLNNMNSKSNYAFGIIEKSLNKYIGIVRLKGIDYINKKATFGIFIGEKEFRSKGIGSEATQLMLDYGFNILNLHNIMLEVFSFNNEAIKSYTKCGFKEIGRRRDSIIYGNKKYDEIYMDIISDEFNGSFIDGFL